MPISVIMLSTEQILMKRFEYLARSNGMMRKTDDSCEGVTITRRRLLKQTFAFSAAAMFGRPAFTQAAADPNVGEHFLMIGDWGAKDMKPQEAVAKGMSRFIEDQKIKPSGVFLLGDNFYGSLKGGVNSERWKVQFSHMYPRSHFNCPFYAVLGNHDYSDDPVRSHEAQLNYQKENPTTRWTLPSKWYAVDLPGADGKPLIRLIGLDSNRKDLGEEGVKAQNEWLKEELSRERVAPWIVVMAHHPLYSNGRHGDSSSLISMWGDLFQKHGVDFYFCGHDHDLQHMEFEELKTSFVLSGGGGARVRPIQEMKHGPYAQGLYGFTHLQVTPENFVIQHVDANRNRLHAFSKTRDGNVVILT